MVDGLLEERAAARAEKDFARADAIRDQLAAAGIVVEDRPGASRWYVGPAPLPSGGAQGRDTSRDG